MEICPCESASREAGSQTEPNAWSHGCYQCRGIKHSLIRQGGMQPPREADVDKIHITATCGRAMLLGITWS